MEPEAGALIAPGAGVPHLGKRLEKLRLVFLSYADASVVNADMSVRAPVDAASAELDGHFSLLGELDGVVHQVQEDLAQGAAIGFQHQFRGGKLQLEVETFLFGERAQGG